MKIARGSAAALGRLRSLASLRVCEDGDDVWLRASAATAELEVQLRALPSGTSFRILDDGQLLPTGRRVPEGRLPAGDWLALDDWLKVELGVAKLAGAAPEATALRIVRGGAPVEPNCLLCAAGDWSRYAVKAPALRLARWTFAADSRGRVVVRGLPLPPIGGQLFVERSGVAIPAGWRWDIELDADVIGELHGIRTGDLALVWPDSNWELLPADAFVGASRSAVRALPLGDA